MSGATRIEWQFPPAELRARILEWFTILGVERPDLVCMPGAVEIDHEERVVRWTSFVPREDGGIEIDRTGDDGEVVARRVIREISFGDHAPEAFPA